jgi:hypothetical protein
MAVTGFIAFTSKIEQRTGMSTAVATAIACSSWGRRG